MRAQDINIAESNHLTLLPLAVFEHPSHAQLRVVNQYMRFCAVKRYTHPRMLLGQFFGLVEVGGQPVLNFQDFAIGAYCEVLTIFNPGVFAELVLAIHTPLIDDLATAQELWCTNLEMMPRILRKKCCPDAFSNSDMAGCCIGGELSSGLVCTAILMFHCFYPFCWLRSSWFKPAMHS